MATEAKPDTINGGCLCGKIRYTVTFPPDYDFADKCTTCQCEQCRKNTGALMFRNRKVPHSAINFTEKSTLRTYYHTPGIGRGFCVACGSFLYWDKESGKDSLDLAVGSIDKADLKQYGVVLTTAWRHLWCADEIVGVTDHLRGARWKYDCDGDDKELMPNSKL